MPEITHEVSVEIEVSCNVCGSSLTTSISTGNSPYQLGTPIVEVDPCETCMDKAKDEGYAGGEASGD